VLGATEFLDGLASPGDAEEIAEDTEPDRAPVKRGNPRRPSRRARAAKRALKRLRPR
jgi:hypothetical protein